MTTEREAAYEDFAREFIRRRSAARPTLRLERVVVATDFSVCSLNAIELAEELARRFGAELVLVHAEGRPLIDADLAYLAHAGAERRLAEAVAHLQAPGLRVRAVLRPGAPVDEIPATARAEGADLVVVGTHGRTGVRHLLLGSVAEAVVRAAPCPVLTVGPHR